MKKILAYLMLAIMTVTVIGCTNDDEPEDPEFSLMVYNNAIRMLYKADTKVPAFAPTPTKDLYVVAAGSAEESFDFINEIVGGGWCGRTVILELGEYGKLKLVSASDELLKQGIYNELTVSITGYPSYTLQIITEEKANGEFGDQVPGVKKE